LSPSMVPIPCHDGGDKTGTQTILINHSKSTCLSSSSIDNKNLNKAEARKGHPREARSSYWSDPVRLSRRPHLRGAIVTDARVAARSSAERRWHTALLNRLIGSPDLYAQAVDAIDAKLQDEATEAEMKRTGGGLVHIIGQLTERGMRL
jgi:hypothetical protein